jgi:hypothetical protein
MNCSNPEHIPEWCQTCRHCQGDGHGVLGVRVGTCLVDRVTYVLKS